MEPLDKLTKMIKDAARNKEEASGFPAMDQVWQRVEARLDREERRSRIMPFRKTGIAAAVLLLLGLALFYLLRNDKASQAPSWAATPVQDRVLPGKTAATVKEVPEGRKEAVAPPEEQSLAAAAAPERKERTVSATANKTKEVAASIPGVYVPVKISGVVLDEFLEPMPGASVVISGTNKGTVTDMDGRYELALDSGEHKLIIKGIGVEAEAVVAAGQTAPLVTRMPVSAGNALAGVEIYGKVIDKRSYTGALTTVTAKDIVRRPVTDIVKAIDGTAPGVKVSSGGGQPGARPELLMRGVGSIAADRSPLIVLDGAPYAGTLVSIDPATVAQMTFLKDAAAKGLYGSRGANGVILITTKDAARPSGSFLRKGWRKVKQLFRKKASPKVSAVRPAQPVAEEVAAETESYDPYVEHPFETPEAHPYSTFSIDVDKAAYANIRRFIRQGQPVPKYAVRIEEMINYFPYTYPQPKGEHPFEVYTEYSEAPWNKEHKLLKIGLQGKALPETTLPPSNLVFLVDVSGSMNAENKLPLLVASLKLLIQKLRRQDKVAIVVYAGAAGVVLPSTAGDRKAEILAALDQLVAGGSTAGGEGIRLAYRIARENFIPGGNNRVILATDGDFNVGASSDEDMKRLIEKEKESQVFLTCLGYGMGNYKDSKMEILADKGNGNYAYIDNIEEARRVLVREFSGTMYSIAKDVKIQIAFNPAHVMSYRLIGYENRKLQDEDFVNDAVDAGELGSGHTVTALYEIIPAASHSGTLSGAGPENLAQIKLRYKQPEGAKSIEMVRAVGYYPLSLAASSPDFKLAAAVAWFGLKLRDSELLPDKETQHILQLARQVAAVDPEGYKSEFIRLVEAVP